jgi:hypothetical protein
MTQNEKDLLLKDLSSRSPYGVKVKYENEIFDVEYVCPMYEEVKLDIPETWTVGVSEVKPYLFPMSSITEEQANELFNLFDISLLDSVGKDYIKINECTGITFFLNKGFDVEMHLDKLMNWLNTNHFDYRGLIPMGLAIDATNKNIY